MAATLAEVLRRFGQAYRRSHRLSPEQGRAFAAILACRTRALGGERLRCTACARDHWRWHACRSRYCPRCQSREREAWRRARIAELLPVPYCHLVFTLPHDLNALAVVHPRWVYDTLFTSVAATLTAFAANPRWLGGSPAFTLVLHTWTQDLRPHLHVHALMACGAMASGEQGEPRWRAPQRKPSFLFPVHALSRVFRGKFLDALRAAEAAGDLPRDPAATPALRRARMLKVRRHDWVVYAKTPLAGPAVVLDYLSRYTHRTAIGNERILAVDEHGVRLRVRDRDHRRAKASVLIDGVQFVGRFLQHVLPRGFKRIRHYGLLAPAAKAQRLAAARAALAMPAPHPQALEDAARFMRRVAAIDITRCSHCGLGQLLLIEVLAPLRSRPWCPRPRSVMCRGPP